MSDKLESENANVASDAMGHLKPSYEFKSDQRSGSHVALWPIVLDEIRQIMKAHDGDKFSTFDLGCGNGALLAEMHGLGWNVAGVDPSEAGIEIAKQRPENLKVGVGSTYDDLLSQWGTFNAVTSLEVIEHVYAPRQYARTVLELLEPGGTAVLTTPFHGYWKNLMLAVTGRMDKHFTALWDHGHIKFWSANTLRSLLEEIGFVNIRFRYAGRFRPFSKSIVAIAERPVQ